MRFPILLLAAVLIFVSVEGKKKTKHATTTKDHIFTGFRLPFFAMRIPIFGGQGMEDTMKFQKPSDLVVFHDDKNPKLKTKTKTSNSTNGPFKTFTVSSETTSDNKSNPQVYEKVYKSMTTLNKNNTGKNFKLPSFQTTHFRIFRPFGLFQRAENQQEDEQLKDCSEKKPCADGNFCDKFFGVCKKQVAPGGACTQKDQCSKRSGIHQCTWGRCVFNSDVGSAGTFCDSPKDCQSKMATEQLGCFSQPDISRFAKVCVPQLGEGATCGRAGIFDMFGKRDEDTQLCQKTLVCRAVGFFGRKACIKVPQQEPKPVKRSKRRHRKHH